MVPLSIGGGRLSKESIGLDAIGNCNLRLARSLKQHERKCRRVMKGSSRDPTFRLSRVPGMPVHDEELLADLRKVAESLAGTTVTHDDYGRLGIYDSSTISRRFGSWNDALLAAGLSLSHENDIPDQRLFENLLLLWQHYGRQPRRRELAGEPSTISQSPYSRRFGSWTRALEAFVTYANSSEVESPESVLGEQPNQHRTAREPSLRLRWRVLHRDRFRCCACGASPALSPGVELRVDHIIPWSKGGETVLQNLQTLCEPCNSGKSNLI